MMQLTIQQMFEAGMGHHRAGRLGEAERIYREILGREPGHGDAMHLLGVVEHQRGRVEAAEELIRGAIGIRPEWAEAYNSLGNVLKSKGDVEGAEDAYGRAIGIKPGYAEAHFNLGILLKDKGDMRGAAGAYRKAIALRPAYLEARSNLGNVLRGMGELDEAAEEHRRALELNAEVAEGHYNLGIVLKEMGKLDEAMGEFRRAMEIRPGYVEAHSNLVFTMQYHGGIGAEEIAAEHRRWDERHGEKLRRFHGGYGNDPSGQRRLRVGYVSGDFCGHPVGRFMLPLMEQHDRGAFEIFCYSGVGRGDEMTERLRGCAEQWREIGGMSDEKVAEEIRGDGIDILVDLSGHTAGNRLLVFARKPAPVQVSYLGYPGWTGLGAMDYRLTDDVADPVGAEEFFGERVYRVAGCNWCFTEAGDCPEVGELPAIGRGYVTFGSFNNIAKVTEEMMEVWGRILRETPGSRLLLKAAGLGAKSVRERVRGNFVRQGIEEGRVELRGAEGNYVKHLGVYGEMDIGLDTFPYHGTTTTCDALWMGVPVITLAGERHVSRVGVSLLTHAGLGELVAGTREEYVRLAVGLARDLGRLKGMREGLREKMRGSMLMDARGFARGIEGAYLEMWGKHQSEKG